MRIAKIVFTVVLISLSAVAATETTTDEDRITNLEAKWSDMFGARDLNGIMALMAQNSVLIMPGSAPIVGVEEIRHATKTMMESDVEVSWKSDFAHISSSGDMAFDYGTATTKMADGTEVQGYYLVVWVKENGAWKIAADMFN